MVEGRKLREKFSGVELRVVQVNQFSVLVEDVITGCQWLIAERNYNKFEEIDEQQG